VWEIIRQLNSLVGAEEGLGVEEVIQETASNYGLPSNQVRNALRYYSDWTQEVDQDIALADEVEAAELARWQHTQRILNLPA